MPHPTSWTCRRCRRVLGTVARDVLHVEWPTPFRSLPNGWVALCCPGCTGRNLWKPRGTRAEAADVVLSGQA